MTTTTLNVHRHAKASSAYAEASMAVDDELDAITNFDCGKDCRDATWTDAEQMTRLAMRLAEIRRQFCGGAE